MRPHPPGAPSDTAQNPLPRQTTIPGIGEENLSRPVVEPDVPSRDEVKFDALADYHSGGPAGAHDLPGEWVANPLHSMNSWELQQEHSNEQYRRGNKPARYEEFIEPSRVFGSQSRVNQNAIDHMVTHANPLALQGDDPEVTAYKAVGGEEYYHLYDGNHRVNAAQRRGQLLMPANVARYSAPNYHRGSNSVRRSRA